LQYNIHCLTMVGGPAYVICFSEETLI